MDTYEDLGAAIGTVRFESEALIQRAVGDGRRRQRRQRLGVGAAVLAVGVLSVGAGLHWGGWHDPDGIGAAAQGTTDQGSGLPSPEVTDARLAALLPVPSDPLSATSGGSGAQPYVSAQRTLDPDGSGTGTVSVDLSADRPLSAEQVAGEDHKCTLVGSTPDVEACLPLADGWMFTSIEGRAPHSVRWGATVVYRDGTAVAVQVTNHVAGVTPTRPSPVLSYDQIAALASDPGWFQPAS